MLNKTEILNRIEIVNPDIELFSDLRRAYIDRDANSIFRLMEYFNGEDINTMRKAFRDDHWHFLFQMIEGKWQPDFTANNEHAEPEDLKKFLLNDNNWSMFRLMQEINESQFTNALKQASTKGIRFDKDSISQGQLKSKMWLINELKELDLDLGTVFLCAGWYGILSLLMFENDLKMDKVRSFDIDSNVVEIAEFFNKPWMIDGWKFKAITEDIHNINFEKHTWKAWSNAKNDYSKPINDIPNTIINTSCEHIENFSEWYDKIPAGKLLVLQSNDYMDIEEHVNISPSLFDFSLQTPMNEVYFSGELDMTHYSRFMRIGIK